MVLKIVKASEKDISIILSFIKKLAEYENLTSEVTATETSLRKTLFGKGAKVECILGYSENTPVAFAIYFYNYSTFLAKPGLYLEDLFVLPEERGKGFGKEMLKYLAGLAVKENCGRFEWAVLDWNEPAINFYKNLGAVPMNDWTVFRLTGAKLKSLGSGIK